MWDFIIKWSLHNRMVVFLFGAVITLYGLFSVYEMRLDALPDISAPSVTIVTDCEGMAPDEVEMLVTFPIETALNGAPKLRRLRSKSAIGMSIVWAEFDWETDQYRARQIVSERLQLAKNQIPPTVATPVMAPMSSIMGEIMVVGLTDNRDEKSEGSHTGRPLLMELRDVSEWEIRRRLLGITGVAQVTPIGGDVKQVQIVLKPTLMRQLSIGHKQVLESLESASENYSGGFFITGHKEYVVRGIGRATTFDELGKTVITKKKGAPVLLRHIADIKYGPAISRGSASINGRPGVLITIQKQPGADTIELSRKIDKELDNIESSLPKHLKLFRDGFRQERFISTAIKNITTHLVESSILVIFILFFFLANKRATIISLSALPLSLLSGIIVLKWFGMGMNTMTLGGFAIAIGALVDDAIIDVENAYRRLRQRAALPEKERAPFLDTIYETSREVRNSIVSATFIIVIVFIPLFFLTGLEGRLMKPLGIAYVVSILTSLIVAMTVTPALCFVLLKDVKPYREKGESLLVRFLKKWYAPLLEFSLKRAKVVGVFALTGTILSLFLLLSFGRNFMPRFNEGSFSVVTSTIPGVSLEQSTKLISTLEKKIMKFYFVTAVTGRTGRSDEKDEHGHDIQSSAMDIIIDNSMISKEKAEHKIREVIESFPGLVATITQPISLRIAHMNTGSEASVVLKIFGDDLLILRTLAKQIEGAVEEVKGVVDLKIEQQTDIPQLIIKPEYAALANLGVNPGEVAQFVETAFVGSSIGKWWEEKKAYDLVIKYPKSLMNSEKALKRTPFDVDGEKFVALDDITQISKTLGPNMIQREDVRRRILVTANIEGRDGRSVMEEIQREVNEKVAFPKGYYLAYGGDFESEAKASKTIFILSLIAIFIIFLILWTSFKSGKDALIIMVNLPLSLIGGTLSVLFMDGILTIASLVGFISLFGIAARNGIMMISHYRTLQLHENASFIESIRRGSMERLVPIMMTALATALALVPIAFALNEPGNEIQAPMALVILGGITSSTILNMIVLPSLYSLFGTKTKPL